MPKCRLCERDRAPEDFIDPEICTDCAERHALPPPSASLRQRVPCPRCHGRAFVRCQALRERAATGGNHSLAYIAPLAATYAVRTGETLWKGRKVTTPEPSTPIGVFEAYICRTCGFTELYARDAAQIPIGREFGTELFEVEGEAPYR